jgi:protein arginine kinase
MTSQVSLSRNFSDLVYPTGMSLDDSKKVVERVTEVLDILGWSKRIHFSEMTEQMKLDYLKKWGIDHDAMNTIIERAILESPNGEIAVIVNEIDHIRIVAKHSGMALFKTYEDIYAILKSIEASFAYAFDEELGYITAELSKVGTGLQVSVMLHLPTVVEETVLEFAAEYVRIKPVLQASTAPFYHVYNALTLGLSETDLLAVVQSTVVELIRAEYASRQNSIDKNRISVEDSVFRAFGVAQYAKIVQFEEMLVVLSSMRFGVELEMLDESYADRIDRLIYTIVAEQSMGFSSKSKDNIRQIRFAHMLKSLFQGEVNANV